MNEQPELNFMTVIYGAGKTSPSIYANKQRGHNLRVAYTGENCSV